MALEHNIYYLFAGVDGATTIEQEYPVLHEMSVPAAGEWTWSVVSVSGSFVAGTSFDVDYTVGAGVDNSTHQYARLIWTIPAWKTGTGNVIDGTIGIQRQNPSEGTLAELVTIHLRTISAAELTIFRQQSNGANLIPDTDSESYTFSAPFNDPVSDPPDVPEWRSVEIHDSVRLGFTGKGAVSVTDTGDPLAVHWDETGTFTLKIQKDANPASYLKNLPLRLRHIRYGMLAVFRQQSGGEDLIPAADAASYAFSIPFNNIATDPPDAPDWRSASIDDSIRFGFSPRGAVHVTDAGDPISVNWDENGTVTLVIQDGTNPESWLEDCPVLLRDIPDTIRIANPAGTGAMAVTGAGDTWNWSMDPLADGLTHTVCTLSTNGTITTTNLQGGEYGVANAACQLMDSGTPVAAECEVPFDISVDVGVALEVGGVTLPDGREKMRYQAGMVADSTDDGGSQLVWHLSFNNESPLSGVVDVATDITSASSSNFLSNFIRTVVSGGGIPAYLPGDAGPHDIYIWVEKQNAGVTVARSESKTYQLSIQPTNSNVNVAVLLDRSGSMSSQSRWIAACSGAGLFAALMANESATPTAHKLGVYWFASGGTPAGTFDGFHSGDTYAIQNNSHGALLDATEGDAGRVEGECNDLSPTMATSIGAGLNLCRAALIGANTAAEAQRVILVLSDGMENQGPMLDDLFGSSGTWGNPAIRIYPLAIKTSDAWVERLATMVSATGGIRSLDVKKVVNPANMNSWFISMFSQMFGWSAATLPPDPLLGTGQIASESVNIHSGQKKVIFFFNHDDPHPENWDFTVDLPGGQKTITREDAKSAPGMSLHETTMGTMFAMTFPLQLVGCEHIWVGEWTMHLKRTGRGQGFFAMGALTSDEMGYNVDLISPPTPLPGDRITVIVNVTDKRGRAVGDAHVEAEIVMPPPWPGDTLSRRARRTPELYRVLARSRSKANRDIPNDADRLLNHLLENTKPRKNQLKHIRLTHQGKGQYSATFTAALPGLYDIGVRATGTFKETNTVVSVMKKRMLEMVGANLNAMNGSPSAGVLRDYRKNAVASFAQSLASNQTYSLMGRRSIQVGFLPSVQHSQAFGYMENISTICLYVEPRDTAGMLLGPGFGDRIFFTASVGDNNRWHAVDMLDGTYEVQISLKISQPILRASDSALMGSTLSILKGNGHTGRTTTDSLQVKGRALLLKNFAAHVCGVTIPLTVYGLAGNRRTREVHLISCEYAARISDENLIWFEDLADIVSHRYDTCEHCLPLICNMRTKEAHKPTCVHAKRIRKAHRKELASWKIAKRQGFDGCMYCLPDKHTR
jgi:hypothetical protein